MAMENWPVSWFFCKLLTSGAEPGPPVPLLRRALGLLQLAAATPPVRLGEPCSNTPTPAPAMPTPADPLAQLMAAVLAYRTQPWA
jgi:hypothetical protein